MESLYNFRTLSRVAYKDKDLLNMYARNHQYIAPKNVVLTEQTSKNYKEDMHGTIKADIIENDDNLLESTVS